MRASIASIIVALFLVNPAWAADKGKEIPFSLVISGGISLGAYEAGYNWALVKYLKEAKKELQGQGKPFPELIAIAGASAGGVNSIMTAAHWCMDESSINDTVDDNLYRNAWLDVTIDKLMPDPDSENGYCQGDMLLSRKPLREQENKLLNKISSASYQDNCSILIGLPFTREAPGTVEFASSGFKKDGTQNTYEIPNERFVLPLKFEVTGDNNVSFSNYTWLPDRLKQKMGNVIYMQTDGCDANKLFNCTCPADGTRDICTASDLKKSVVDNTNCNCNSFGLEANKKNSSQCPKHESGKQEDENGCSLEDVKGTLANSEVHPFQVMAAAETTSAFPLAFSKHKLYYCREKTKTDYSCLNTKLCPEGYCPIKDYFVDGGLFDNIPLEIARNLAESNYSPEFRNGDLTEEQVRRISSDLSLPLSSTYKDINKAISTDIITITNGGKSIGRTPPKYFDPARAETLYSLLPKSIHIEKAIVIYMNDISDNFNLMKLNRLVLSELKLAPAPLPAIKSNYIYIDPERRREPNLKVDAHLNADKMDLWNQMRFLGGTIQTARKYELFSAARTNDWNPETQDKRLLMLTDRFAPLTGDYLLAFGGFMDKSFMEYDYYVGVQDAIYFIENKLCKTSNICPLIKPMDALKINLYLSPVAKGIIDALRCAEDTYSSKYDGVKESCLQSLPTTENPEVETLVKTFKAIMSDKGKDIEFKTFLTNLNKDEFKTNVAVFQSMLDQPQAEEWRHFLPLIERGSAHLKEATSSYTKKPGGYEKLTYGVANYYSRSAMLSDENTLNFTTSRDSCLKFFPNEIGSYSNVEMSGLYFGYDSRWHQSKDFAIYNKFALDVVRSKNDSNNFKLLLGLDTSIFTNKLGRLLSRKDLALSYGPGLSITYADFDSDRYRGVRVGAAANVLLLDRLRLTIGYNSGMFVSFGVSDIWGLLGTM